MKELSNTVEQLSLSVNEIAENATTLALLASLEVLQIRQTCFL